MNSLLRGKGSNVICVQENSPLIHLKNMTNKWERNKTQLFTYSLGVSGDYRYSVSKICILIYSEACQFSCCSVFVDLFSITDLATTHLKANLCSSFCS